MNPPPQLTAAEIARATDLAAKHAHERTALFLRQENERRALATRQHAEATADLPAPITTKKKRGTP